MYKPQNIIQALMIKWSGWPLTIHVHNKDVKLLQGKVTIVGFRNSMLINKTLSNCTDKDSSIIEIVHYCKIFILYFTLTKICYSKR